MNKKTSQKTKLDDLFLKNKKETDGIIEKIKEIKKTQNYFKKNNLSTL
jgi:hypothetical protein